MKKLQIKRSSFWRITLSARVDHFVCGATAMVLMTRKYVENWILWVVVNVISVVIFTYQGVYVMALEYLILTGIALNGTWLWIKEARQRPTPSYLQRRA